MQYLEAIRHTRRMGGWCKYCGHDYPLRALAARGRNIRPPYFANGGYRRIYIAAVKRHLARCPRDRLRG